ncbi:hypothetical protein [Catenulispora subtropica]|uniref:Uncharacterized protein n=1 Tax=Catenulispora subtropica TaxID=450798 RepID=A0ABP5DDB0_9ACTN
MEPLIPLARAVASEVDRLGAYPAAVHIDDRLSVVVVEGLAGPEVAALLQYELGRVRLRVEDDGAGRLRVYPS